MGVFGAGKVLSGSFRLLRATAAASISVSASAASLSASAAGLSASAAGLSVAAAGLSVAAAGTGVSLIAGTGVSLIAGTARLGGRSARAAATVTGKALLGSTRAAVSTTGTALLGADPLGPDGVGQLTAATRGMFEPDTARRTRRVSTLGRHAHVELAAPTARDAPAQRAALRRHLQRLDGVDWVAVNDVVGRVLVAFDDRRVGVDDLVGVIASIEQARGGPRHLPQRQEHPGDLEPLIAATVSLAVHSTAVGVAFAAKILPIPAVTRHATVLLPLLDAHPRFARSISSRIGPFGTDLTFTGLSALLHSITQSPTVPALNAAAAGLRVVEVSARRAVWRQREPELCRLVEDIPADSCAPPGQRPAPLPAGPVESYAGRVAPAALATSVGLLPLTRRPSRSADALKAVSGRAAQQGREAFAAVLDVLQCRRGVVPMDGSAYRRLDRIDAAVVDGHVLCTGSPVLVEATGSAPGWDDARVWSSATRLLDDEDRDGELRLVRGGRGDPPGGEAWDLVHRDEVVGAVTVAEELDPLADALLDACHAAGLRLVVSEHAGTQEIAGRAAEIAPPGEALEQTVRRLQTEGHAVLAVSSTDSTGLVAADVGVAPSHPDRAPAWGADLITRPGLDGAWRIIGATARARELSRTVTRTSLAGNVLGGLLAAVGGSRRGQRKAMTPGKTATATAMALGIREALSIDRAPVPPETVHTPWHALEPEQVLRRLDHRRARSRSDPERGDRLPRPAERPRRPRLPARFLRTVAVELSDPLSPVLATGAAATAILGEPLDAALVSVAMLGNAVLSGFQRLRAETTLESLLIEQEVAARRETGGRPQTVPAARLRVGDVVLLESGDIVPADARLLAVSDLEVDESSLTGESASVRKELPATPGAELADRRCMVFDGTAVTAGSGRAIVVATGPATQAGRAAAAAGGAAPVAGMQARLAELTREVLPFTLAGGAVVGALGVLWRRPLREAVASGVAVAVAAVPEGLPLVATVAQLAAARRLSRRGAVVRSARVLEALGRVDTVCFDKTGTITENRLSVVRLLPVGDSRSKRARDQLLSLAVAAAGAQDDRSHETDRAIHDAARQRGLLPDGDAEATLPFASDRGFSAAVRDGRLLVKGAPEEVLRRCTGNGRHRRTVRGLTSQGLRVLAVAERTHDGPADLDDAAHELRLRGFVGLADTIRPSAATAVEQLRASGVRVLVVTGDHPETASAIAAEVGVPGADQVITGAEFARATETERTRLVQEVAVFARLSPEQKVSVITALHRAGATVAMTGDGVNDAAAIRLADVGIGIAGAQSPAARGAADLVLTEPDVTQLVDALGEGRAMWSRVRDAVAILVGGNAGEVAFTAAGTALGGRAPIGTRQLLLVNLLTDMFPAMAVAVVNPRHQPDQDGQTTDALGAHPMRGPLLAGPYTGFTDSLRRMVLVRGAATAAGATGAWTVGRFTGTRTRAGTIGLAALITTQLGQTAVTGRRSPLVLGTVAGSLATLVTVVQTPGLSQFFGCRPLGPLAWLTVLGWATAATVAAEAAPTLLWKQEIHEQR